MFFDFQGIVIQSNATNLLLLLQDHVDAVFEIILGLSLVIVMISTGYAMIADKHVYTVCFVTFLFLLALITPTLFIIYNLEHAESETSTFLEYDSSIVLHSFPNKTDVNYELHKKYNVDDGYYYTFYTKDTRGSYFYIDIPFEDVEIKTIENKTDIKLLKYNETIIKYYPDFNISNYWVNKQRYVAYI